MLFCRQTGRQASRAGYCAAPRGKTQIISRRGVAYRGLVRVFLHKFANYQFEFGQKTICANIFSLMSAGDDGVLRACVCRDPANATCCITLAGVLGSSWFGLSPISPPLPA
jgi:hypothetical protein